MSFNLNTMTDQELVAICTKYNILDTNQLRQCTRESVISQVTTWHANKQQSYQQKSIHGGQASTLRRTNSQPIQVKKQGTNTYVPKANINTRERRHSEPFTDKEKTTASHDHTLQQQYRQSQQQVHSQVQQMKQDPNAKAYDEYGMYPIQPRVVAIGDVHGDLSVTLMALRLAKVISQDIYPHNVKDIQWTGGTTYVIQLGDQIDRCRPDNWNQNCIDDLDNVVEDEGNNMLIIQIFQKLDAQAKLVGGRVLGNLGNHELMNVDRDFRYVSPKEFLEFVPENERHIKRTSDGYPYGYYHRLKVFERGGNIAKHYAVQKKSITMIGTTMFVHGGFSHALASKYSIHEINQLVKKWLLQQTDENEERMFDEIFRDDDDMSPFWCRLYSEDDGYGENTTEGFKTLLQILNKRNKTLYPIKRIVLAHTPQYMENKYMNGLYDNKLWRIDVGMSRAFGKQDGCGENKYRQIQVLEILNDDFCKPHMVSYQGRFAGEGIGTNATFEQPRFLS